MKKRFRQILLLIIGVLIAFVLWYFIFVFPSGNFWLKISIGTLFLAGYTFFSLRLTSGTSDDFKTELGNLFTIRPYEILIGIGSAAVLYGVFWFGNWFLKFLFSGAGRQISNVYASKGELTNLIIALLLAFITSPAEEIFWRGFLLKSISERLSPIAALIISVFFYAMVHIWTLNIPLIIAAAVAGLAWGFIYIRTKSLVPVIISHALWSVSVFIIFPFA